MTRRAQRSVSGLAISLCSALANPAIAQVPDVAPDTARSSLGVFGGRQPLLGMVVLGSAAVIQIDGLDQLDAAIKPSLERRNAFDRSLPRNLGRVEVAAAMSAGAFLLGEAFGSDKTARVGVRTLEALAVNSALTMSLKIAVGRARPSTGFEEDSFVPFSLASDRWSFPSGHTSTAFAWATALSNELREDAPFVPYVVYPLAVWVGTSRMLDGKHWFTDTVAGAAVGIFSAQIVDRLHSERSAGIGEGPQFHLLVAGGPTPVLGGSVTF